MQGPDDALLLTVRWEAQDFDAYVALNQRMRACLAPRAMAPRGLIAALRSAVVLFAIPLLSVTGLALWWGAWSDRVPDLVAVFLIAWFVNCLVMQALGWWSDRLGRAELREAFDASAGIPAEVAMDATGFTVSGTGFSGRYSWSEAVLCERWADHVIVLHPRTPLMIPRRDSPEDLFGRIIELLEVARP